MTILLQIVYGLKPHNPQDCRHMYNVVANNEMIQYYLCKGMHYFCNKRGYSACTELLQLHTRETFNNQDTKPMTKEEINIPYKTLYF